MGRARAETLDPGRRRPGRAGPPPPPGDQSRPGSVARASMPAHASRTLAPAPSAPRAALGSGPPLAPPSERRHTRRTLRQPGIPLRQASIGGFGLKHAHPPRDERELLGLRHGEATWSVGASTRGDESTDTAADESPVQDGWTATVTCIVGRSVRLARPPPCGGCTREPQSRCLRWNLGIAMQSGQEATCCRWSWGELLPHEISCSPFLRAIAW